MIPITIFTCAAVALSALSLGTVNLIKRKNLAVNRLFSLFCLIIFAAYILSCLSGMNISAELKSISARAALFLPLPALATLTIMLFIYPVKKPGHLKYSTAFLALFCAADFWLIFFSPWAHEIPAGNFYNFKGSPAMAAHSAAVLFAALLVPSALIAKIRNSKIKRIQYSLKFYLLGLLFSYILFILLYLTGELYLRIPAGENFMLYFPAALIMASTHHLVFRLRSSDFRFFYMDTLLVIIIFLLLFIPTYLFLKNEQFFASYFSTGSAVKALLLFIYFALIYRLLSPVITRLRKKDYNEALDKINRIIMPIDDIKHHTDSESFWNRITKDSIEGLRESLGIMSANFLLYNSGDNGYYSAFGYGSPVDPDFIPAESEIIKALSKIEGVFGKSYLETDYNFTMLPGEILDFFNRNRIETAMLFRNMDDRIIGFLLLGELEGNRPYTAAHIEALEIYRIKIQNLLVTGFILDEVTADQVKEHDRLVVRKIKDQIIPKKIYSIPNIRISSMHIDNSDSGGDYFDSVRLSEDRLSLFISDISYSGIDSALLGLELYSILHSRSFVFSSPEKMLNMMNQVIKTSSTSNKHSPCSSVIIDSGGNFLYSGASYNPMLIYDPDRGEFMEIKTSSIPIGIEMEYRYQLTAGKLRDGSIGLLFSDGLISSCNNSGETFPINNVKDIIIRYARENPAVILRELFSEYKKFTENREQVSDVSAVLFKKVKPDEE